MPELTVEGFAEIERAMERLTLLERKKVYSNSLRKAAKSIHKRIEQRAPDDPKTKGSRIRENVVTNVVDQTASGATAIIGVSKEGFPAIMNEVGTAHQQARPVIGPAFDETVEEATEIMMTEAGNAIEEEFQK